MYRRHSFIKSDENSEKSLLDLSNIKRLSNILWEITSSNSIQSTPMLFPAFCLVIYFSPS
jgi:hypothetical protein